jgi:hypothetical protein
VASEELIQRGYLSGDTLKGERYGKYEHLNIGQTSIDALVKAGVTAIVPASIDFPFTRYNAPKKPSSAKPDQVFLHRIDGNLSPVAVAENKAPKAYKSADDIAKAQEQALFAALALGVHVAVTTDGTSDLYIDVQASANTGQLCFFDEPRDLNPAVLESLLSGEAAVSKDPKPLAESVWQSIWVATKAEPKEALLTFTEFFNFKFLSDNLPRRVLPEAYSFYAIRKDAAEMMRLHGMTAIEYYFKRIRPKIEELFPARTAGGDSAVGGLFGLTAVQSPTSIIGYNAFQTSEESLATHNRTFVQIMDAFEAFGPLNDIDPQFKLRLYETFLRRSARQQRLGQFFTPRNVVRPMIRMAELGKLPEGGVLLDPAAGVGGFVLEPLLFEDALPGNVKFVGGLPQRKVRAIGVDVDPNLHMLAKSNMLIHLAEAVRDPDVTLEGLNQAMADTFVLMNAHETLGALERPPQGTVDAIITNPPYVTQGSAIYKREIDHVEGKRNGVLLSDYYNTGGLGLEALFLRYISGALKPGGKAFVIVPLGLLNRTEPRPKMELLKECNLLASIQLPRNTFFNTSQKTAIIVLQRRRTAAEPRPKVLCGIARSIGETLDWRRIPTPDDNDLGAIADAFVAIQNGDVDTAADSKVMRLVDASQFGARDRWDVARFWSDSELVELGIRDDAVSRVDFVDDATTRIEAIGQELEAARQELEALTSGAMVEVSLSDQARFNVRSGTRVRTADIREHPGDIPIYSCFKTAEETKGSADRAWLEELGMTIEEAKVVTVNANGASVGKVYVRDEVCALTDDVIAVDVRDPRLDHDYVAVELRRAVAAGGFLYEAKLFATRVKELKVSIPIDEDGNFDPEQQRLVANAVVRFEEARRKLIDVGEWAANARVA